MVLGYGKGAIGVQTTTVLCVDDDTKCLECRSFLLTAAGYEVLTASSGTEALLIFASNHIDLTILDYDMPDMDGGSLASRLKEVAPHIPVFMISGQDQIPIDALRWVDEFISKGEKPAKLLSDVRDLLRARSLFIHSPPTPESPHAMRSVKE